MLLPPLTHAPTYLLAWALAQAAVLLGALATALARISGHLASLLPNKLGKGPQHCAEAWQTAYGSNKAASLDGVQQMLLHSDKTSFASLYTHREQPGCLGTASDKSAFLQQAGSEYGYGGAIDSLRQDSLARLQNRVYVDHAGAALYAEDQPRDAMQVSTFSCTSPPFGRPSDRSMLASLRLVRHVSVLPTPAPHYMQRPGATPHRRFPQA